MKVAIVNVKYSPNLGDGLLAECLERELVRHDAGIEVVPIDLAGRTAYGTHGRHRAALMRTLERLPPPLRQAAAWAMLNLIARTRLRPAFRAALADCDAVVIGGGNLFADDDLNFPIKLAVALSEAGQRGVPVAVHAVGVSANWSKLGHRLFARGLAGAEIVTVGVRDERSQAIWNRRLAPHGVRPAGIARDPGLLAARCYVPPAPPPPSERVAALCITDPLAVRYHGGADGRSDTLGRWYAGVIAALAAAGWRIALFTNGSPEDRAFLEAQAGRWRACCAGRVRVVPAFARPGDLVAELSRATVVIAHRMHACIAAYACGVPTIGLRWDPKLDSFFAMADREDFLADTTDCTPATLVALAGRAAKDGVEPRRRTELGDAASAGVAALAHALRQATTAA